MHTVRVVILRLLEDTEHPEHLCGALQVVPNGEGTPFTDEQTLLALLYRVIGQAGHAHSAPYPPSHSDETCEIKQRP